MKRKSYLFAHLTSSEIKKYREEVGILLLPVGATEQHSDYTVVGTDFLQVQYVVEETARRTKTLALPLLPYGNSYYHSAFPGTITVSPMTFVQMTADIIKSVLSEGFKALLLVNGHGENTPLLKTAVHVVKEKGIRGTVDVIDWFMLPKVREIEKRYFGEDNGVHVTIGEVSCNLAMFEDFPFPECEKDCGDGEYWIMSAEEFKEMFPDGVALAKPWLANREIGEEILKVAIEELTEVVERLKKEVCRENGRGA